MRYWLFIAYVAISGVLMLWALSDCVYGSSSFKKLAVRMVLALIWPFALISNAGRDTLLYFGREGESDGGKEVNKPD
jgi:hypothetical protein